MELHKLRLLAGIPVDLSKTENAAKTVKIPAKLAEAAKVPQHRGELSPKTKDNMRARVTHAKKALEALELARTELMDVPAIDFMEDIPDVIRKLHYIIHGEDGTGGLSNLHRVFKQEFDNTIFPEDIEAEREKQERDLHDEDSEANDEVGALVGKKKTNEAAKVGFEKPKTTEQGGKVVPKDYKKPFKLAPGSETKTGYDRAEDQAAVQADPNDNVKRDANVVESKKHKPDWLLRAELGAEEKEGDVTKRQAKEVEREHDADDDWDKELGSDDHDEHEDHDEEDCEMTMEGKKHKPKWLEKAEVTAEEKEHEKVPKKEQKKVGVKECSCGCGPKCDCPPDCKCGCNKKSVNEAEGPLFARDADHPKHDEDNETQYPSWSDGKKPVNVVSDDDGPSLYYPQGSRRSSPSQTRMNPYNENQKVRVPAAIKNALVEEANMARKLAETFTMRRDWDNKNFHENLANAFDTLAAFLDKETIYGIKEAQIFMTSLMSPFMYKIPGEVIKFIAAGGTQRSLKSYLNDVKEPHTGTVFSQDSNGLKYDNGLSK